MEMLLTFVIRIIDILRADNLSTNAKKACTNVSILTGAVLLTGNLKDHSPVALVSLASRSRVACESLASCSRVTRELL